MVDTGKLERVQVKTTYHKDSTGAYMASLRTRVGAGKMKKFDPAAVDLLFVLTEDGSRYLIPSGRVAGRSAISLGHKYSEFKCT